MESIGGGAAALHTKWQQHRRAHCSGKLFMCMNSNRLYRSIHNRTYLLVA
uniref:Uncharacterized protein n=1 Tax=Arundo donax TaxID=35708 RepID=A0A0A9EIF8_ARUDO